MNFIFLSGEEKGRGQQWGDGITEALTKNTDL